MLIACLSIVEWGNSSNPSNISKASLIIVLTLWNVLSFFLLNWKRNKTFYDYWLTVIYVSFCRYSLVRPSLVTSLRKDWICFLLNVMSGSREPLTLLSLSPSLSPSSSRAPPSRPPPSRPPPSCTSPSRSPPLRPPPSRAVLRFPLPPLSSWEFPSRPLSWCPVVVSLLSWLEADVCLL